MSIQARLGDLHLSYSSHESDVDLFLSVSLAASTNETNGAVFLNLKQRSNMPWLCRGRGYKILLQVYVDSRPANGSIARYLQNIILNSEFWNQFCLCPSVRSSRDVELSLNNTSQAVIHLSYRHDLLSSAKSSKHKLLSNVSFTDVQPPEGFPVVEVESIVFVLNYCHIGNYLEGSNYSSLPLTNSGLEVLADVCASSAAPLSPFKTNDALLRKIKSINHGASSKSSWQENYESSLSQFDDIALHSSQESSQSVISRESTGSITEEASLLHIGRLFDAGLRLSICNSPKKLSKEVSIKNDSQPARLSAIMPSLWCPGFLRAIAERSVFLPTISHAISYVIYPNCTSQSLRAKLEKFCPSGKDRLMEEGLRSDASSSIYAGLQRHLWAMLQKQLSDTKEAQNIMPIIENLFTTPTSKSGLLEESRYYSKTMFGNCSDSDHGHMNGDEYDYDEECYCDFGSCKDDDLLDSNILTDHLEDRDDAMLLDSCPKNENCDKDFELEYENLLWNGQHIMDEPLLLESAPSPPNDILDGFVDTFCDEINYRDVQTYSPVYDDNLLAHSLSTYDEGGQVATDSSHDFEENMLL